MASRSMRRLTPGFRADVRWIQRENINRLRQRWTSSSPQSTRQSSDLPWIICSALVFGPAILYIASPFARNADLHRQDSSHVPASDHATHTSTKNENATPAAYHSLEVESSNEKHDVEAEASDMQEAAPVPAIEQPNEKENSAPLKTRQPGIPSEPQTAEGSERAAKSS